MLKTWSLRQIASKNVVAGEGVMIEIIPLRILCQEALYMFFLGFFLPSFLFF
jgi:hypothetical protein